MFCSAGGPYIAPLLIPLLNPSSWSVLVLCVFLPILYSADSELNSDTDEKGNKTKNSGKAFGYAFLIYYVICVLLMCSVMQGICKVSNKYNPSGVGGGKFKMFQNLLKLKGG